MKYQVSIEQSDARYVYEVEAFDEDEAEAVAIRVHNATPDRNWAQRAFVSDCVEIGGPQKAKRQDINDGKHEAKRVKKERKR